MGFDDVEPRYTIALACVIKGIVRESQLSGPFTSLDQYQNLHDKFSILPNSVLLSATDDFIFPLLPIKFQDESIAIIKKMLKHDRFDSTNRDWFFVPVQGDLNATKGKPYFNFENLEESLLNGNYPVLKGASFDTLHPDSGEYYATIEPETAFQVMHNKESRIRAKFGIPVKTDSREHVAFANPRIAFRNVSRATDSRTIRCSLVRSNCIIQHSASYLRRVRGDARDEAYLLGILSSIPLDWFARRFIEIQVGFYIVNPLRIPEVGRDCTIRRRIEVLIASLYKNQEDSIEKWSNTVLDGTEADNRDTVTIQAEIDLLVSRLFDLDINELQVIYQTFQTGGTVNGKPWNERWAL